jgi:hypothetical protein
MITQFVEVTDGIAYGKFAVCRMTGADLAVETAMPEAEPGQRLLTYAGRRRFNERTTLIIDLQRGTAFAWPLERGAIGMHHYLTNKLGGMEQLVCPLYMPFVLWLHERGRWAEGDGRIEDIPRYIDLRDPE